MAGPRHIINNAADLLDAAAEVVEERGWCRYTLESSDGRVCARGAMFVALTGRAEWGSITRYSAVPTFAEVTKMRAEAAVLRAVGHVLDPKARWKHDLAVWNNEVASSADEVVDALRAAAKNLREKEQ